MLTVKNKEQQRQQQQNLIKPESKVPEHSNILFPKKKPIQPFVVQNKKADETIKKNKAFNLEDALTIKSVDIGAYQNSNNQSNLSYQKKQNPLHLLQQSNFGNMKKNNTFPKSSKENSQMSNRIVKVNFLYQNRSQGQTIATSDQQMWFLNSECPKKKIQQNKPFFQSIQKNPLKYEFISPYQHGYRNQLHQKIQNFEFHTRKNQRNHDKIKEERKKICSGNSQIYDQSLGTATGKRNMRIQTILSRETYSQNESRFHNEARLKIKKLDSIQALYFQLKNRESEKYEELIIYQQDHNENEKESDQDQDKSFIQLPTPKRLFKQFESELNLRKEFNQKKQVQKRLNDVEIGSKGNISSIQQSQIKELDQSGLKPVLLFLISIIFILLVQILK